MTVVNIDDFKEDIQINDSVCITTIDGIFTGTISKIRDSSIKIINVDQSIEDTIFFDRITQYRKILNNHIENGSIPSNEKPIMQPEEVAKVPFSFYCDKIFQMAQSSVLKIIDLDALKLKMKQSIKSGEYNKNTALESIINSFSDAIKNHVDNKDNERMKNLISRSKSLFREMPSDKFVALLTGVLLNHCQETEAADYYALAGEFESAAAIIPALDQEKNAYVAKTIVLDVPLPALWYMHKFSPKGQWAVFETCFMNFKKYTDKQKSEFLAFVATCLKESGASITWANTDSLVTNGNIDLLTGFVKKLALDRSLIEEIDKIEKKIANKREEERKIYVKKIEKNKPKVHKGKMIKYDVEKKYGFINYENNENIYFYISQVNDGRLRYLLTHGKWDNCIVRFTIGTNIYRQEGLNNICADDIQLISVENVQKSNLGETERFKGTILNFDRFNNHGKIQCEDGKTNTFQGRNVVDPYLKAYISTFEMSSVKNENWPVEFSMHSNAGKKFAYDIVSLKEFSQDIVNDFIRSNLITERDVLSWKSFNDKNNLVTKEELEIEWEDGDYIPLPSFENSLFSSKNSAKKTIIKSNNVSAINPSNVIRIRGDKFENIKLPDKYQLPSSKYYAQAHRLWLNQKYDDAEKLYIKAIEDNDNVASTIGELLSLYIKRGNENADYTDAFSLMKHLGREYLTTEKYLNNMITLYSASHSDPERLIECYREAIDFTSFTNRRLHYIQQKALLEQNNKKYQDAVESCDIWEQQVSKFSIQPPDSTRRFMERIRCVSLYGLGRKEEAQKLAKSLEAFFPGNESLQQILKGNFDDKTIKAKKLPTSVPAFEELPFFLQNIVDAVSLEEMKQTVYITDNDVKDGTTEKDIQTEYGKVMGGMAGASNAERAKSRILAAKYIKNCLAFWPTIHGKEEKLKVVTEQTMLDNIVYGLDYRISAGLETINPKFDTIRYYYLLILEILLQRKEDKQVVKKIEDYIVRYLLTALNPRAEEMRDSVIKDRKLLFFDNIYTYSQYEPDDDLQNDFKVLFVQLLQLLKSFSSDYITHNPFDERLILWVANQSMFNTKSIFGFTKEEFVRENNKEVIINNLIEKYQQDLQKLTKVFTEREIEFSSLAWLKDASIELARVNVGKQDRDYCKRTIRLFDILQELLREQDFDARINHLGNLKSRALELHKDIEEYPTQYSYRYLQPFLGKMQKWINRETVNQYKLAPSLDIERLEANKDANKITVAIRIKNKSGYQRADNPSLKIDIMTKDLKLEQTPHLEPIGGISQDCYLYFLLGNNIEIDALKVLDLKVSLFYEYLNVEGETTDGEQLKRDKTVIEKSFSISLNNADYNQIDNPFEGLAQGGAVLDKDMMFGREKDIATVIGKLCDSNHRLLPSRSIALFGQKRSGKTTLLNFVRKSITQEFQEDAICIDLGSVGSLVYTNNEEFLRLFLATILNRMLEIIDDNRKEIYSIAEKNNLEIPSQDLPDEIITSENYIRVFDLFMRQYNKLLKLWRKECQLILFLDEFTYLYNYIHDGSLSSDILKFWKAFMETYNCSSVIVGQDSMAQLRQDFPNELGIVDMQRVHYLSFEATKDMLFKPLRKVAPQVQIEEDAYKRLFEYSNGSAYWHMILCSRLVFFLNQNALYKVTVPVIDNMVQQELEQGDTINQQLFQPLYNDSLCTDDNNREDKNIHLLKAIANASRFNRYVSKSDLKIEGIASEEIDEMLEALVQRKVLDVNEGKYRIFVELFSHWLNRYFER